MLYNGAHAIPVKAVHHKDDVVYSIVENGDAQTTYVTKGSSTMINLVGYGETKSTVSGANKSMITHSLTGKGFRYYLGPKSKSTEAVTQGYKLTGLKYIIDFALKRYARELSPMIGIGFASPQRRTAMKYKAQLLKQQKAKPKLKQKNSPELKVYRYQCMFTLHTKPATKLQLKQMELKFKKYSQHLK
jgi:hypothetical protein